MSLRARLDRLRHEWDTTPAESVARRLLYSAMLAAGLLLTVLGSIFYQRFPPIPLKLIPDLRVFLPLASGLSMGLLASFGGASRRKPALWTAVGLIVAFHLEEATIHWIGPYPGSITGTRVGILGTAGSLLALLAVLLLHVEVESTRLRRDAVERGADAASAEALRMGLVRQGARRLWGLAAGVGALALLVRAGEAILGNDAKGGAYILLIGAALLLALAVLLLRLVKPRAAEPDDAAADDAEEDVRAGEQAGAA